MAVQVGKWGGTGGYNPWTFTLEAGSNITKIKVNSDSEKCVYSIRFTYKDRDKIEHNSETYGGDGGTPETITLADGEYITGISGTFGLYYSPHVVIASLSFQSNKLKNYGPYGNPSGTTFSLPVTEGKFVGFYGNYGDVLDSLGAILSR